MTYEEIKKKLVKNNPQADVELADRCNKLAEEVHSSQKRLSGDPYMTHTLEVANILLDLKMDSVVISAGLLHDVLEDSSMSYEELKEKVGEEVATLVEGVTKLSFKIKPEKEIRQADNFRKILLAMSKDIRVIVIKLADRLHNMRTLQFLPEDKQRENAEETLQIYAPLAHRLGVGRLKWELEDLCMKYLYPKEYEEIGDKIAAKRIHREKLVEEARTLLLQKLKELGIAVTIVGRAKHFYSIFQKMKRLNKEFEEIYDITALRIISESVEECYSILGVIHSIFKPLPGQFDDYIAMPKTNKYQSLHTNVIGPNGLPLEIQIRTKDMNETAEFGVAAHWYYKEGGQRDKKAEHKIEWLRHLIEWMTEIKDSKEFMDLLKMDLFGDEVFAFTPKGDVFSLPLGSTAVDFAYAVHSSLGDKIMGAKINNKMSPIRAELKTGDIVEIITASRSNPNPDWLKFVRTNKAKHKIRHFLKIKEEEEKKNK
ncbi:MAG: RelA/SpoT family protein [Candidatus Firestonebacteria bacterium]|nr:RelA/SpoT family protein [Candidatus Firestonebacteria bacterium]